MTRTTHYETLGVPRTADRAAIVAAWRDISRHTHPDAVGDDSQLERYLAAKEAYETLSDANARTIYDYDLRMSAPSVIEDSPRQPQSTEPQSTGPTIRRPATSDRAERNGGAHQPSTRERAKRRRYAPTRRYRHVTDRYISGGYLLLVLVTCGIWILTHHTMYSGGGSGLGADLWEIWLTSPVYTTAGAAAAAAGLVALRLRRWVARRPAARVVISAAVAATAANADLAGSGAAVGLAAITFAVTAILAVAVEIVAAYETFTK